jgi:3'-5' exoribonuclease
METVSLQELKRRATAVPQAFEVRAQVEAIGTRTGKTGKPYLEAKLADASEHLVLRAWEDTPLNGSLAGFGKGDFLAVSGSWTKGDYGVEPRDATARALAGEEIEALLGGPEDLRARQEADYAAIVRCVDGWTDPRLRSLGRLFLERFGDRLRRTAAARQNHHARRGGLVEHVAQMMRSADAVCGVYPALNRDLLLAGVLFHDCGKLWENAYPERGLDMPYTEMGELLGHIPAGMELVNRLWRDLAELPEAREWAHAKAEAEQARLHLLHLIASHHGELAFGSPVLPKTPEAVALHYVDNLDAKLEMFAQGYAVASPLGKGVWERVRPLPANLVSPLPAWRPEDQG